MLSVRRSIDRHEPPEDHGSWSSPITGPEVSSYLSSRYIGDRLPEAGPSAGPFAPSSMMTAKPIVFEGIRPSTQTWTVTSSTRVSVATAARRHVGNLRWCQGEPTGTSCSSSKTRLVRFPNTPRSDQVVGDEPEAYLLRSSESACRSSENRQVIWHAAQSSERIVRLDGLDVNLRAGQHSASHLTQPDASVEPNSRAIAVVLQGEIPSLNTRFLMDQSKLHEQMQPFGRQFTELRLTGRLQQHRRRRRSSIRRSGSNRCRRAYQEKELGTDEQCRWTQPPLAGNAIDMAQTNCSTLWRKRKPSVPALATKMVVGPPELILSAYSTRRSCDGAMRGADGKTTSAPLTVW